MAIQNKSKILLLVLISILSIALISSAVRAQNAIDSDGDGIPDSTDPHPYEARMFDYFATIIPPDLIQGVILWVLIFGLVGLLVSRVLKPGEETEKNLAYIMAGALAAGAVYFTKTKWPALWNMWATMFVSLPVMLGVMVFVLLILWFWAAVSKRRKEIIETGAGIKKAKIEEGEVERDVSKEMRELERDFGLLRKDESLEGTDIALENRIGTDIQALNQAVSGGDTATADKILRDLLVAVTKEIADTKKEIKLAGKLIKDAEKIHKQATKEMQKYKLEENVDKYDQRLLALDERLKKYELYKETIDVFIKRELLATAKDLAAKPARLAAVRAKIPKLWEMWEKLKAARPQIVATEENIAATIKALEKLVPKERKKEKKKESRLTGH